MAEWWEDDKIWGSFGTQEAWERQYQAEHGRYPGEGKGETYEEALRNLMWSQAWAQQHGRSPSDYEWKGHYYDPAGWGDYGQYAYAAGDALRRMKDAWDAAYGSGLYQQQGVGPLDTLAAPAAARAYPSAEYHPGGTLWEGWQVPQQYRATAAQPEPARPRRGGIPEGTGPMLLEQRRDDLENYLRTMTAPGATYWPGWQVPQQPQQPEPQWQPDWAVPQDQRVHYPSALERYAAPQYHPASAEPSAMASLQAHGLPVAGEMGRVRPQPQTYLPMMTAEAEPAPQRRLGGPIESAGPVAPSPPSMYLPMMTTPDRPPPVERTQGTGVLGHQMRGHWERLTDVWPTAMRDVQTPAGQELATEGERLREEYYQAIRDAPRGTYVRPTPRQLWEMLRKDIPPVGKAVDLGVRSWSAFMEEWDKLREVPLGQGMTEEPFTGGWIGAASRGYITQPTMMEQHPELFETSVQDVPRLRDTLGVRTPEQERAFAEASRIAFSGPEAMKAAYYEILELIEKGEYTTRAADEILNKYQDVAAELMPAVLLDPLNLPVGQWLGFAKDARTARGAVQASQRSMDDALKVIAKSDEVVTRTVSKFGPRADEFLRRMNPWALTPESLALADQSVVWKGLAGLLVEVDNPADAVLITKAMANDPATLLQGLKVSKPDPYFAGTQIADEALLSARPALKKAIAKIDSWKSVKAKDGFKLGDFLMELDGRVFKAAAELHGVSETSSWLRKAAQAQRSLMSESFMNLSPRYWVRNASSAYGHLIVDDLLTFQPVSKIDDFMARLGVGARRLTQKGAGSLGEWSGGQMAEGASKLGKIPLVGQPLGAASEAGAQIAWGETHLLGRIPVGEEAFYKRAWFKGMERWLNKADWVPELGEAVPEVLRGTLRKAMRQGLSPSEFDGIAADMLKEMAVGRPGAMAAPWSLVDDVTVFDGSSWRGMKRMMESVTNPDEVTAELLRKAVRQEQEALLKIIEEAPAQPQRKIFSELTAKQDLDDAQGLAEAAVRSGASPDQAQAYADAVSQAEKAISGAEDDLLKHFVQGEADPDRFEVFTRAWEDLQNIRTGRRRVVDEARAPIVELARRRQYDQAAQLWPDYFGKAGQEAANSAAASVERVNQAAEQLRRLTAGETFEQVMGLSRRQLTEDWLYRFTADRPDWMVDEATKAKALGHQPGRVGQDTEMFQRMVDAQRRKVDNARSIAWESGRRSPDRASMDVLGSAQKQVDEHWRWVAGRVEVERAKVLEETQALWEAGKKAQARAKWAKWREWRNEAWRAGFDWEDWRWQAAYHEVGKAHGLDVAREYTWRSKYPLAFPEGTAPDIPAGAVKAQVRKFQTGDQTIWRLEYMDDQKRVLGFQTYNDYGRAKDMKAQADGLIAARAKDKSDWASAAESIKQRRLEREALEAKEKARLLADAEAAKARPAARKLPWDTAEQVPESGEEIMARTAEVLGIDLESASDWEIDDLVRSLEQEAYTYHQRSTPAGLDALADKWAGTRYVEGWGFKAGSETPERMMVRKGRVGRKGKAAYRRELMGGMTPQQFYKVNKRAADAYGEALGRAQQHAETVEEAARAAGKYTKRMFSEDVRNVWQLEEREATAVEALVENVATAWWNRTGRRPEEWYTEHLKGMVRGGEIDPEMLLQRDRWFYKAEQIVGQKMPNRASAEQVKAILSKGGVKGDELEWSGVMEWLGKQKGAVSKDEVLSYLQANRVQIKEVVKGGADLPSLQDALRRAEQRVDVASRDLDEALEIAGWNRLDRLNLRNTVLDRGPEGPSVLLARQHAPEEVEALVAAAGPYWEAFGAAEGGAHAGARYPTWRVSKTPGGNYRELLLTMPESPEVGRLRGQVDELNDRLKELLELDGEYVDLRTQLYDVEEQVRRSFGLPGNQRAERELLELKRDDLYARYLAREQAVIKENGIPIEAARGRLSKAQGATYRTTHWDEPNILAHVRFSEDTTRDGRKVLFIEEIQSDWHQKGRAAGYSRASRVEDLDWTGYELRRTGDNWERGGDWMLFGPEGNPVSAAPGDVTETEAWNWVTGEYGQLRLLQSPGVPPAPFAKTWHELTLKRMLDWAAENGFDSVAWTTGRQQADLYSLAHYVDDLRWRRSGTDLYYIFGYKDGAHVFGTTARGDELADQIGRELAAAIVSSPESEGQFVGRELAIGGQGMKGFYDQIVPSAVKKLTKRWGVQPGTIELPAVGRVWGFDITPQMRKDILNEGQALFQAAATEPKVQLRIADFLVDDAPSERSAAFTRWFGDSKIKDPTGKPLVVYHGTTATEDFSVFRGTDALSASFDQKLGPHFAEDPNVASRFGLGVYNKETVMGSGKGRVYPVYLRMENPHEIPAKVYTRSGTKVYDTQLFYHDLMNTVMPERKDLFVELMHPSPRGIIREEAEEIWELLKAGKPIPATVAGDKWRFDLDAEHWEGAGQISFGGFMSNWGMGSGVSNDTQHKVLEAYKDILRRRGHDGVVYYNTAPMEVQATSWALPAQFGTSEWYAAPLRAEFPEAQSTRAFIPFDPTQIKSAIGNRGTFDINDPNILVQGNKAAVEFVADGRAILRAFEQADFSSLVHELGHVFRRTLPAEDMKVVEQWAGVVDGNWTRAAEEQWARGFERYMAEGSAPNSMLADLFEQFKDFMVRIYERIVGSPIDMDVSPEVRDVMDRLVATHARTPPELPKEVKLGTGFGLTSREELRVAISDAWSKHDILKNKLAQMEKAGAPVEELAPVQQQMMEALEAARAAEKAQQAAAMGKVAEPVGSAYETVGQGKVYYRGTKPGETKRIRVGVPEWDELLFVTKEPKHARSYGPAIEEIVLQPDARVLVEGTKEWRDIFGRADGYTGSRNMLERNVRVVQRARELGYDAVEFVRQGDVGTAILNESAILRRGGAVQPSEVGGAALEFGKKAAAGGMELQDAPENVGRVNAAVEAMGNSAPPSVADLANAALDAQEQAIEQIIRRLQEQWLEAQAKGGVVVTPEMEAAVADWLNTAVKPQWQQTRAAGVDYAEELANFAMLDYSKRRNLDEWLSLLVPYHYWYTRSMKNWADRVLSRPGLLANYARFEKLRKQLHEKQGVPARFEHTWQITPDWRIADPLRLLIPFSEFGPSDFADEPEAGEHLLRAVQKGFEKWGFGALPLWDIGIRWMTEGVEPAKERAAETAASLLQAAPLKGATALMGIGGPGGVDMQAGMRKAMGMEPLGKWDLYRVYRALDDLEKAGAVSREDKLLAIQDHTGPAWDMALQRSAVQAGIPALSSYLTAMPVYPYPQEERARYAAREYAEEAPTRAEYLERRYPGGVNQAPFDAYPAVEQPGWAGTQLDNLRGGRERDAINAEIDARKEALLRERPWDAPALAELERERHERLQVVTGQYGTPERAQPPLYKETPEEAEARMQQERLAMLYGTRPQPQGEDWSGYYDALGQWEQNLPTTAQGLFGAEVGPEALQSMASPEAMFQYAHRYDTPSEAAARAWEQGVYRPTWETYRAQKDAGAEDAFGATVGAVGPMTGQDVLPLVQQMYGDRWPSDELGAEIGGMAWPAMTEAWRGRMTPEQQAEAAARDDEFQAKQAFWEAYNSTPKGSAIRRRLAEIPLVGAILGERESVTFTAEQYRHGADLVTMALAGLGPGQDVGAAVGDPGEWAVAEAQYEAWIKLRDSRWPGIRETQTAYFESGPQGSVQRRSFLERHTELKQMWDEHDRWKAQHPLYVKYYDPDWEPVGAGGVGYTAPSGAPTYSGKPIWYNAADRVEQGEWWGRGAAQYKQ